MKLFFFKFTLFVGVAFSLSANAYEITELPITHSNLINNTASLQGPVLLPWDSKHFIVYSPGKIHLINNETKTIEALLPKPNLNSNLIYLTATENNHLVALDNKGLYDSMDMGKNWIQLAKNSEFSHWYYNSQIITLKNRPHEIYITTREHIRFSKDDGKTWKVLWKERATGTNEHPFQLFFDDRNRIYLITHTGKLVFTENEGQSFQEIIRDLPPEPQYWVEKEFCSSQVDKIGFLRIGGEIFKIESPDHIVSFYKGDKLFRGACFFTKKNGLVFQKEDSKNNKTDFYSINEKGQAQLVGSLNGVYSFTQENSDGTFFFHFIKNYNEQGNRKLYFSQELSSPILAYPEIFPRGDLVNFDIKNSIYFAAQFGDSFGGSPYSTYFSHDGGQSYTKNEKNLSKGVYFNGSFVNIFRCEKGLCLGETKDEGRQWTYYEVPKEVSRYISMLRKSGNTLYILATNGAFFTSDFVNWYGLTALNILKEKEKKVKSKTSFLRLETVQHHSQIMPSIIPIKSFISHLAPHGDKCFGDMNYAFNTNPKNEFVSLVHGCYSENDEPYNGLFLSKDKGATWEKIKNDLPESLFDIFGLFVPTFYLEEGSFIIQDYQNNSLFKSTDGGYHFINLIEGQNFDLAGWKSFAYFGSKTLALSNVNMPGGLLLSKDGGNSWERIPLANSIVNNLNFSASNTLYFVENGDGLFKLRF